MSELGLAYIRVSTDRQDEHSPETQLRIIHEYFEKKKWQKLNEKLENVDIVLDERVTLEAIGKNELNAKGCFGEAGSGYDVTTERTQFENMIKYAKKHKIRHLIFYRANRFSRNDEDWGVTKSGLRKAGATDIFIHSIDKPEMAFHMFEKFDTEKRNRFLEKLIEAESESYQKSVDATEGVKTKFEKGQLFYKPPYGFRTWTERRGNTKKHIVKIIHDEMEDAKLMFELFESGNFSLASLARELKKRNIVNRQLKKPFTTRGIYSILTNVCFVGLIHLGTKTTKSTQFEAQIPKDQFYKVQQILKGRDTQRLLRTGKKQQQYKSPFAKLCRCHFCQMGIVSDTTTKKYKTGKSQSFTYLRCTSGKKHSEPEYYQKKFGQKYCVQPYNAEAKVIEEIDKQVSQLWMDEIILSWLETELKEARESDVKKKNEQTKSLRDEQQQIKEKMRKLLTGWEDEIIDDETYQERVQAHKLRQKEIEVLLQQVSRKSEEIEEQINISLELMENLGNQWFTLNNRQKADILEIMAEKVVLGKDGKDKPLIIWDLPWSVLFDISLGSKGKRGHALGNEFRTSISSELVKQKVEAINNILTS